LLGPCFSIWRTAPFNGNGSDSRLQLDITIESRVWPNQDAWKQYQQVFPMRTLYIESLHLSCYKLPFLSLYTNFSYSRANSDAKIPGIAFWTLGVYQTTEDPLKGSEPFIKPDYTKSAAEVYHEVALISHTASLSLLSSVQHSVPNEAPQKWTIEQKDSDFSLPS
jgi:hypothetical protein